MTEQFNKKTGKEAKQGRHGQLGYFKRYHGYLHRIVRRLESKWTRASNVFDHLVIWEFQIEH